MPPHIFIGQAGQVGQDGQAGQQVIIAICFLQTQPWLVGWSMETFNANLNWSGKYSFNNKQGLIQKHKIINEKIQEMLTWVPG